MIETRYKVLTSVTEADYQWTSYAILQRESDGALFVGVDSGCSCYYPEWDESKFETYKGLHDVEPFNEGTFQALVRWTSGTRWMKDEVANFLVRARELLR